MSKRRGNGHGTLFRRQAKGFWVMAYYDSDGRRRIISTGTTCHSTAEQILAKKVADVALRIHGVIDARIDRFTAAERRPLVDHVEDFARMLRGRSSPKHARTVDAQIRRLVELTGAKRLSDLTPSAVQDALASIRAGDETHAPAGLRTCAAYHRSAKQLSRWLARDGRVSHDLLVHLPGYNTQADRRYQRRALSSGELRWLITAAEQGRKVMAMSGPDRAMLYRVASGSGFRVSELRSLTPERFDLDGDPPSITVLAAYSKRRRDDRQPIRRELADLLRPWLVARVAGEPVFAMPEKMARMLRVDLEAGRTAWIAAAHGAMERADRERSDVLQPKDAAGRVLDFHCLRHTYVSQLVASGASVKVCQELARHSTPALTIGIYAHTRLHDLTAALDAVPAFDANERPRIVASTTGTHGR
jgi:integrase